MEPIVRHMTKALLVAAVIFCVGCSGLTRSLSEGRGKRLAARSLASANAPAQGGFTGGLYSLDEANRLTILLYQGTLEQPSRVVTLRMFWRPRAGKTPIDPTATNATVHYILFEGDEQVGIYSGAGYLYPQSALGGHTLSANLWESIVALSDQSEGFADDLGQALLIGSFRAVRDEAALERALRDLNRNIRRRLGFPRLVEIRVAQFET